MEKSDLAQSGSANPLARAVVVDKNGIITSSRCHICKSKFRTQIEAMYEQNSPIPIIKKFLEDNGESYAGWRLKHHFDTHFKNLQQQAAIVELIDNLDEMMKRRRNMVDDLTTNIEIAWMRIAEALVLETGNDMDKKLKKERMISDHQKTIKENWELIMKQHDGAAVARALEERMEKVWQIKLENATDETERKLIISTLKDFQEKYNQLAP